MVDCSKTWPYDRPWWWLPRNISTQSGQVLITEKNLDKGCLSLENVQSFSIIISLSQWWTPLRLGSTRALVGGYLETYPPKVVKILLQRKPWVMDASDLKMFKVFQLLSLDRNGGLL